MAEKELIVVAGPNGAGKTTFAEEYLREHPCVYLSADAIAAELAPQDPSSQRMAAGREFVRRVEQQLAGPNSFLVESTMSGRGFRQTIQAAHEATFRTFIAFVYLDSADSCWARVQVRARAGGHDVPESDVRRRFPRSLRNFWHAYRQLADEWLLVYNAMSGFQDVAFGSGTTLSVRDESLFLEFLQIAGGKNGFARH